MKYWIIAFSLIFSALLARPSFALGDVKPYVGGSTLAVSSNTTLTARSPSLIEVTTAATDVTITLPACNSVIGKPFVVVFAATSGAGKVNLVRAGGDTIVGASSTTSVQLATVGQMISVIGNSSNKWNAFSPDQLKTYHLPTGIDAANIANGSVSNTEFQYLDGVTGAIQTQFTGKQALDTGLTNISALTGTGVLCFSATDTPVLRNVAVADARLTVTNSAGVAGNITLGFGSVASTDLTDTANLARLNGLVNSTEYGYLANVTSDIQTQFSNKQGLDATLTSLAGFNSNGLMVQTAADTFTARSIALGSAKLSGSNLNGVSGNPTIDLGTVSSTDLSDTSTIARTNANNNFTSTQLPNAVNLYDLGSTTKWWKDLYLSADGTSYVKVTASPSGNRTVTLAPGGDSVTVRPDTGATSNFLTAISTTGVISKAQPSKADLSDGANIAVLGGNAFTATQAASTGGTYDLGNSSTGWWRNLYLGDASHYILFAGSPTSNRTVSIPDANSVIVVPKSSVTNQWLKSLGTDGVLTSSQPASTDLSDSAVLVRTDASNVYSVSQSFSNVTLITGALLIDGQVTLGAVDSYDLGTNNSGFRDIFLGGTGNFTTKITKTTPTADRAFTIPDANCNPVIPDAGSSNNFLTAISSGGVISKAQPSVSNLSDGSNVVKNNQANTYSSGTQSFASVTLTTGAVTLGGLVTPGTAETYDIGTANTGIRDIYLGGTASFTTRITKTTPSADRTFTLPNADSNSVIPDTGSSNNFLTAISSGGVISKAQPAFTNISGTCLTTQGGTGTTTAPSANGQLLIGAAGGTYVPATLTQGAGVTITNGTNSITIASAAKEILVKRTTSDDTRTSNTTKAVASGLTTALSASKTYDFVATMFCTVATATPDLKCSFTGPSGSTVTWAALSSNALGTVGATASGVDGVVQLPNYGAVVSMSGTVTTTTAGNITFEWAQNTSNANTLTLRTGSNITFTER